VVLQKTGWEWNVYEIAIAGAPQNTGVRGQPAKYSTNTPTKADAARQTSKIVRIIGYI
jgi:hypothetical protein